MVVVDREVAVTTNREIEQAMRAKGVEHVIEEADTGVDGGVTVAVDTERDLDIGFGRRARDGGGSVCHIPTHSARLFHDCDHEEQPTRSPRLLTQRVAARWASANVNSPW